MKSVWTIVRSLREPSSSGSGRRVMTRMLLMPGDLRARRRTSRPQKPVEPVRIRFVMKKVWTVVLM